MKQITYHSVPSVSQFQRDSSVTFAVRKDDRILAHLDWLLERLAARDSNYSLRRVILADLFLTANFWIKSYHEKRPNMKKERYPAVLALFESVVKQLCVLLGCNKPGLAAQIEEIYGRDLTEAGRRTDENKQAHFYDKLTLAENRLRFKGGLAYHYNPAGKSGPLRLEPLDSADYFTAIRRGGADAFDGWAPFVMTLEREFYVSKHTLNEPDKPNIFHSAYTAGGTVAAAGTMEVKHGRILGIRPDSGHYKPLEQNIVGALQALGMFGVVLGPIKVYDFMGNQLGTALEFMQSRLSWQQFQTARQNLRDARVQNVPPPTSHPQSQPQQPASVPYGRTPTQVPSGSELNTGRPRSDSAGLYNA